MKKEEETVIDGGPRMHQEVIARSFAHYTMVGSRGTQALPPPLIRQEN